MAIYAHWDDRQQGLRRGGEQTGRAAVRAELREEEMRSAEAQAAARFRCDGAAKRLRRGDF